MLIPNSHTKCLTKLKRLMLLIWLNLLPLKSSVKSVSAKQKLVKSSAKTKAKARKSIKTTVRLSAKIVKPAAKQAKKIVKPVVKAEVKTTAKPAAPKIVANLKSPVKAIANTYDFKVGDYLVYPTHGVGGVVAVEKTEIAGTQVTLYVLNFEKEKMTLRVPVARAQSVGLRRLSSSEEIGRALSVLKGRPKIARGMWSRRATEYGQKINSGNIEAIAQVVRDLHKNVDDPDRSYSERVIYESAFDRLCGEYAAINKINTKEAQEILVQTLGKKAA